MNEGPFVERARQIEPESEENSFLFRHCKDYSLSAMAIVFGIGSVLAGLIITVLAIVVQFNFLSSPVVGYACAAAWFVFSSWLWLSLVMIGKTDRKSRVSDADLNVLQALFFATVFGHWLFASSQDKAIYHQVGLVFEWCVIVFHILYFLLALCVWVRLPLRSYVTFAVMSAFVIFQTMH